MDTAIEGVRVTAPFAAELCGYRNGYPSTSDASQKQSIEIGRALFDRLGVPITKPQVPSVSKVWVDGMTADLEARLAAPAPHLVVRPEGQLQHFEQYAHLGVARGLVGDDGADVGQALTALETCLGKGQSSMSGQMLAAVQAVQAAVAGAEDRRRLLLDLMADESPLNLDLAVERPTVPASLSSALPHLVAGFSLKWSLRTDRLQDPRTQGAQMAAMRRGRMPHFAAVTMEPRPYMLGRLGMGTGDLDCVYHLALPELIGAVDEVYTGPQRVNARDTFRRMIDQRRLRDYEDLVGYLCTL